MLFDTDVLIWAIRGNPRAASVIDKTDNIEISIVSYMELVRGARNKKDLQDILSLLSDLGLQVLPLTENIGHRAAVYLEEYSLKTQLDIADALIAATAAENRSALCSGNAKHYRIIADIELKIFKP
jgi:predicted nucleic acid-binding protein